MSKRSKEENSDRRCEAPKGGAIKKRNKPLIGAIAFGVIAATVEMALLLRFSGLLSARSPRPFPPERPLADLTGMAFTTPGLALVLPDPGRNARSRRVTGEASAVRHRFRARVGCGKQGGATDVRSSCTAAT